MFTCSYIISCNNEKKQPKTILDTTVVTPLLQNQCLSNPPPT